MLTYEVEGTGIELMYDQAQKLFLASVDGLYNPDETELLLGFANDADFFNPEKNIAPEEIITAYAHLLKLRGKIN